MDKAEAKRLLKALHMTVNDARGFANFLTEVADAAERTNDDGPERNAHASPESDERREAARRRAALRLSCRAHVRTRGTERAAVKVTCRLCEEPLHEIADLKQDEFIYVGKDNRQTGRDRDVAHLFDPSRNPFGATDPYDALNKMADLTGQAMSAKKVCLTPLYWCVAREYSILMVRLGMGMSFHVHQPDTTPVYTGEVPCHCGWPMWLRPSGWQCRKCEYRFNK